MTNGGNSETSGADARRARRAALLVFVGIGLAFAIVNAVSVLDERARIGRPVEGWEPWVWELSSLAGFLLIAPLIAFASQRFRPPSLSWPAAVLLFALLSVPASLAHVLIMVGLRHAIYAAVGDSYQAEGGLFDIFVYEYRKDLITYTALVLLPHIAGRLLEGRRQPELLRDSYRVEVKDGSRTYWLAPDEIDWAQAAGNYVEIRGAFGAVLHRSTLATLEGELAHRGFVRIHRSRIVRTAAIRSVETKPSGDIDVTLASGETVGGSRRYRSNLAEA